MSIEFPERLSALLPPPRDDEPASLRQDILDELGDHLVCAYNRELLRSVDANVARRRVLERFGDPAAVARRLWLDAMRSKIMAQRVLIATCLVLMLAIATFMGLTWQRMNQDQVLRSKSAAEMLEANRRMEAAFAQAQTTNQEMMKQLTAMSEAVRHPRSPDWNPVIFKLTEETLDGPPVAEASLSLTRGSNPPQQIDRISDASGVADFGSVQPGDYRFFIQKRFAKGNQSVSGEINIQPGSEVHKSIVCPKSPPDRVTVHIKFPWPADLEKEQLVTYAPFVFRHRTLQPGLEWSLMDNLGPERPNSPWTRSEMGGMSREFRAVRSALCGPGTKLTEILNTKALLLWTIFTGNLAEVAAKAAKLGPGDWADILVEDLGEVKDPSDGLKWEPGTYGLNELIVLRPKQSPDVEAGRKRFDVLVAIQALNSSQPIHLGRTPPERDDFEIFKPESDARLGGQSRYPIGFDRSTPTLNLSQEYWTKVGNAFEARRGEVNEWTIPLPDELIRAVREALK
jgi:hypothetical protein